MNASKLGSAQREVAPKVAPISARAREAAAMPWVEVRQMLVETRELLAIGAVPSVCSCYRLKLYF